MADFKEILVQVAGFSLQESSGGRRKPLAQISIDMAKYYSIEAYTNELQLDLKPTSIKVKSCQLEFGLSCVLLREGKATYVNILIFVGF